MSRFTHSICAVCWNARNPGREPVKIREEYRDEKPDICCYCQKSHGSGILVRGNPEEALCGGKHPEDETEERSEVTHE